MEYHPRYAQPFTLREAVGLDVAVITEEISRLQNSLSKLHDTQAQLRKYIQQTKSNGQEADADILQALEENKEVIGSQEERITILKMALSGKGIDTTGEHYNLPKPKVEAQPTPAAGTTQDASPSGDGDGGVYL